MDKKIKKIIVTAILIVAVLALSVTVYAYLQNTLEQSNKFEIAEGSVAVTEVFTEPETMSRSNEFEKQVMVENKGSSDEFVRVYLDFSDSRVRDKSTIVYSKDDTTAEKTWAGFLGDLPSGWEYIPDTAVGDDAILGGYFYYKKILAPGDVTPALIEKVKTTFSDSDNPDEITGFDIIVYTESVQTTEIDAAGTQYNDSDWKTAWRSFLQ